MNHFLSFIFHELRSCISFYDDLLFFGIAGKFKICRNSRNMRVRGKKVFVHEEILFIFLR